MGLSSNKPGFFEGKELFDEPESYIGSMFELMMGKASQRLQESIRK